jgi:hypothetical protein
MARLDPTSLQFQQAFRGIRKHDWPATLDDLPADTVRYRLVRLRAVLIARGYRLDAIPVQRPPVIPPSPPLYGDRLPRWRGSGKDHALSRPLGLDRKRLAAGERDDD